MSNKKKHNYSMDSFNVQQGPAFGEIDGDGWGGKMGGWFNKYGSSIILPIIALLILAGGIYLYIEKQGGELIVENNKEKETVEQTSTTTTENSKKTDTKTSTTKEETKKTDTKKTDDKKAEIKKVEDKKTATKKETEEVKIVTAPKPEKTSDGKAIKASAGTGDGVTHLARRAVKEYTDANKSDFELTKEHKVYVEDYLKRKIGSKSLAIGEEVTFSNDLIQEALNNAKNLTKNQLSKITPYANLVPEL